MKNALTTSGTRSTNALNLGKLQRLFKKAILELLVAVFPAGNSLTLVPAPLALAGGSEVETGFFPFAGVLNGVLDKRHNI